MAKSKPLPVLNEGVQSVPSKGRLWALTDKATGNVALTTRGLLAVYTSRDAARAAKKAGNIRVENPSVTRFMG